MTTNTKAGESFIVLHIGSKRFALRAESVVELSAPVRLHTFPHTSQAVSGVIIRRRRIIPVYDVASTLVGRSFMTQRFYLVSRRRIGKTTELGAMPVSGECELASGAMQAPAADCAAYVCGSLPVGEESIDVLDFDALVKAQESQENIANGAEARA